MKSVWKWPLLNTGENALSVPRGTSFLSAHMQDDQLCVWGLVDPAQAKEVRKLLVAGTGHTFSGSVRHIATVLAYNGKLVWHVFEQAGEQKA